MNNPTSHMTQRGPRRACQALLAALASFVLFGGSAALAFETDFDNHLVHHNVINTTFLTPEVARAYEIRRSSNRALINITVMEKTEGALKAVPAEVRGRAVNRNQQVKFLGFRTVQDGDSVYQIAEVPVRRGEELAFEIDVSPTGTNNSLPLRFSQRFYGD